MNVHPQQSQYSQYSQQTTPVLIVDEDPVIRDTLRTLLHSAGYPVAEAADEAEALDYLHGAVKPHVVVLDVFQPLEKGGAVLHAAEQDATLQQHCYLLITAMDIERLSSEEQRLIHEVCAEVLSKPVNVFEVLAAVSSAAAQLPSQQ